MKFIIAILSLCCISISNSLAQHSIYIEGLGVGGWGSLNYERKIWNLKKVDFSARVGLSTYGLKDFEWKLNPDISIPLGVNVSYGKKHVVELGAGITLASIVKFNFEKKEKGRSNQLSFYGAMAYKYQMKKGIFFKASYYPLILFPGRFQHWGGIGIGYSF